MSFGHTSAAFLAHRKTVTRRDWRDKYAAKVKPGDLMDAWDKSPRVIDRMTGKPLGHKVGVIRIVSVTKEPLSAMPDSDYEAEGFAWLTMAGAPLPTTDPWKVPGNWGRGLFSEEWFDAARKTARRMFTVRFDVVEVCS